MKRLFPLVALLVSLSLAARAQVGIGTTSPDSKSALDIRASDKGLLIPRLTASQRTGITSPPQGLMVYQTDGTAGGGPQTGFWYYTGSGGWVLVNPTGAADNLGNHTASQNLNLADKLLVGGTAGAPGTNGLSVSATGQVGIGTAANEALQVATGNVKLGNGNSWASAADDRLLKFGDGSFVTLGETGADDLLQFRARNFRFDRSSGGTSYTGFVGIGPATAAPLTRLSLSPSAAEPQITLFDGGSLTDHYGFGVSSGQLNYHVGSTSDAHVFSAAGKNGDGTELARLTGAGRLGLDTAAPFSQLANTATNVVGADGFGVGEKSLTWSSNLAGYAGAFFNANAGAGQNGLAVKVAGANAAATAFDVSQGPTAATAGTSLLTVRANGLVGIRSIAPNATLEVRRGTAVDGTAAFWGTTRTSHFNYSTDEDTYIRGGKATSDVLLNDNGGSVGVGTTTPLSRLSISPATTEPKITLWDNGSLTATTVSG